MPSSPRGSPRNGEQLRERLMRIGAPTIPRGPSPSESLFERTHSPDWHNDKNHGSEDSGGHGGPNKMPKKLGHELQQLRHLIKMDVRDLFREEMKRMTMTNEKEEVLISPWSQKQLPRLSHSTSGLLTTSRSSSTNFGTAREVLEHDDQNERKALLELKETHGLDRIQEAGKKLVGDDVNVRSLHQIKQLYPSRPLWVTSILDQVELLMAAKEPTREGCMADLVRSRAFQIFFTLVIAVNAVFMTMEVNASVRRGGVPPDTHTIVIDKVFLTLYALELAIKIYVHRLYFFWNADVYWNTLDFGLVAYSILEIALSTVSRTAKATWMRSLRLFRIAKVLRVLRVVKSFKDLQLIMSCITGSMMSLSWSVVMLMLMFYMFSLMLVMQTGLYIIDSPIGEDDDLLKNFGTVQASMWTLFKTTFGGDDWSVYYEQVEAVGPAASTVWFCFIVFTQIALLNILTGVFVQSALKFAEGDAQMQALKHEEKTLDDAGELARLCTEWGKDGKGSMSKRDFKNMSQTEEFSRYLRFIGLHISDIRSFFDLISGPEDEAVSIPAFVAGCMQLRGFAKSSDLVALTLDFKRLKRTQYAIFQAIREDIADLKSSQEKPSLAE